MAKRTASFDDIDKIIDREFNDTIDLSKQDSKVKIWFDSGVYAFNYICSKNLFGAYPKGRVIGLDGLSGTGKSLMAAVAMRDPKIDRVIIVETEGGGSSDELIEFAGVDRNKVRIMKASTFASYKLKKADGSVEEIKDSELPKNKDTDKYLYIEGATSLIRRLANTFKFNAVDGNVVIILDSLGNINSVRSLGGTSDMGKRAQDITNFFKIFDNEFEQSGLTLIFTNKMYQTMALNGPSHVQTGGESPIYNSSLYVRLSTTAESDDVSGAEERAERDRKNTALGASIKKVKAVVRKSRFGTELRRIPFLLDFSVGPVRLSGLFTLLYDFGVISKSGGAWYEIPEIWEKKFQKAQFTRLVLEDEENLLKKFQELLEKREVEIKAEHMGLQLNDEEEVKKLDDGDDLVDTDFEFDSADADEIKKSLIREAENN